MSSNLTQSGRGPRLPLLALLHPRELTPAVVATLALGVLVGAAAMRLAGAPLWVATALVLALLLVPSVAKWRADLRRYGSTATLLSESSYLRSWSAVRDQLPVLTRRRGEMEPGHSDISLRRVGLLPKGSLSRPARHNCEPAYGWISRIWRGEVTAQMPKARTVSLLTVRRRRGVLR